MKTVDCILQELREVKPCCRSQLYRYLAELHINPVGARQRPQRYPADTAQRILKHLGFEESERPRSARILSMGELRKERRKGKGAK